MDEGERLLNDMQRIRDELSVYEEEVKRLNQAAVDVVPFKVRRDKLRNKVEVKAICNFVENKVSILYILNTLIYCNT